MARVQAMDIMTQELDNKVWELVTE
jgi:hypothetical protein